MEEYQLFSDGGARGNPGPAASAAILLNPAGEIVCRKALNLGETTNNVAEYNGILLGLQLALAQEVKSVKCHLDSELVVMQLNGAYRVKEKRLKELWEKAMELKNKFERIKFVHVRREQNADADALVNLALDTREDIN